MTKDVEFIGKCLLFDNKNGKTLVVGDLHLGYGASNSPSGLLVAKELFENTIKDLEMVFRKTGRVGCVVLIGDVKHEFGKISQQEWSYSDKLIGFLKKQTDRIVAIRGNHDILTGIIAERFGFEVREHFKIEDTIFVHGDRDFPEIWDKKIIRVVLGHVHPAVELSDNVRHEKFKCFAVGKYKKKEFIIVPSFIESSKGTDPRDTKDETPWNLPVEKFKIFIVGEELEVLDFGTLKKAD